MVLSNLKTSTELSKIKRKLKEVTRLSKKDKDENENCMASSEDVAGHLLLVF